MEIYILDSLLRRTQVVDRFESLIWTERYDDIGDFSLLIKSSRETRGQFLAGTQLAMNLSYRVMVVETTENKTDSDGKMMLSVKGRSLESILEDRVAKDTHADLTAEPYWVLTGTPGDIARQIFGDICRLGHLSPDDIIPFLQPGTIFPLGTIPESDVPITINLEVKTVYEALKDICKTYDLGFRLVRNFDTSQLYFDIYSGSERTTRQTVLPPVIFSVEQDNLQDTTEFMTAQKSKNVAYVYSELGSRIVYADNVDPDVEGFERRVLLVKADIPEDTLDVQDALLQIGKAELYKSRAFTAFDGQLNQNGEYSYGLEYNLGDLVEMRNIDGEISYKRVTEQIFVDDTEGERSYPTLTMNAFISENTWLSQKVTTVWEDFDAEEWIDM